MKDRTATAKDTVKETVNAAAAAAGEIRHLGDFIRDQRAGSGISLRQLARTAGVSNPYLSQIERGLRNPSAEILQQIAKALRISAEALYVQAGFLEQRVGSGAVVDAVMSDERLNERQKQVLLEIYESFRREDAAAAGDDVVVSVVTATPAETPVGSAEPATPAPAPRTTRPTKRARKRPAPAPDAGPAVDPTG